MRIIKSIKKKYGRKGKLDSRVRICIECGSNEIYLTKKGIKCNACGIEKRFVDNFKHFKLHLEAQTVFEPGDIVRIIDADDNPGPVYKIKKIKKGKEGILYYLLKSESNPITLLYHESKESYLLKEN